MPEEKKVIRVGVLRREPPSRDEVDQISAAYDGKEIEFIEFEPNSPQETIDQFKFHGMDAVLLRPQTLVDKALEEGVGPFILTNDEGKVVRLVEVQKITEEFHPES